MTDNLEMMRTLLCRLDPALALSTFEEAVAWVHERGMATVAPACELPSVFAACHEPPYRPGSRGYGTWPATKWWWGPQLTAIDEVVPTKILRGRVLLLAPKTATALDPLVRAEIRRAANGAHGPDAAGLLAHLEHAGPSLLDEVQVELGFDAKRLRAARRPLERVGVVISRSRSVDAANGGHRHTSELALWNQVVAAGPDGATVDEGRAALAYAAVHAAVLVPRAAVRRWFSWPLSDGLLDDLIAAGRVIEAASGILAG
jgi:hypothetical protein